MYFNLVSALEILLHDIHVKVNHILAPDHDGAEDGEGEEEHRTVAADLLVASHLLHNSITLERMVHI